MNLRAKCTESRRLNSFKCTYIYVSQSQFRMICSVIPHKILNWSNFGIMSRAKTCTPLPPMDLWNCMKFCKRCHHHYAVCTSWKFSSHRKLLTFRFSFLNLITWVMRDALSLSSATSQQMNVSMLQNFNLKHCIAKENAHKGRD